MFLKKAAYVFLETSADFVDGLMVLIPIKIAKGKNEIKIRFQLYQTRCIRL